MKTDEMNVFLSILEEELVPAMGCTEPISVAYAAALSKKLLGALPESAELSVSSNIIKNVKSVVVPHTGGLRGIEAAAAAGFVAGDPDKKLEVLSGVTSRDVPKIKEFLKTAPIRVEPTKGDYLFEIRICARAGGHESMVHLAGDHTNVIRMELDKKVLLHKRYKEDSEPVKPGRNLLTVEKIVEFADTVPLEKVSPIIENQIACNTAVAKEGLTGNWGAHIGKVLLESYGDEVHNRAKAMAAAGSDARMSGCELPVVINSGSGNQGMTASLPVIVYAEELKADRALLIRALVVSNLITIHMKTGIGCLSAYCGATSAGCGAAAGISYLYGGKAYEISHTIVNAVAIASGMICDGAKPSCAAKIASAVEAGLLGLQMQQHGTQFYSGDGIVIKGVENTIRNIGKLAKDGMRETDREIIRIMTGSEDGKFVGKTFLPADILIPKVSSMEKWSVIACDQFTSQPEYWQRVRSYTDGAYSSLNLILPEAEMDSAPTAIKKINRNMESYLADGVFQTYKNSYIYVERTLADRSIRRGVIGAVDLEDYDYSASAQSPIRATERTVPERIPPRVKIRENASLELPHILMLCDDERHILLESLEDIKNDLPLLYDFDLMEDGGHIAGWLVEGEAARMFDHRIGEYEKGIREKYAGAKKAPLPFAVGDGNHSLATAKACYEAWKKAHPNEDTENLPARYALVELENLHDNAQQFEPIHRIVTQTDPFALLTAMKKTICSETGYPIVCYVGGHEETLYLDEALGQLPIAILQKFLDSYLEDHKGTLDYIHGDEVVKKLAEKENSLGILLPNIDKTHFFQSIVMDGVLPRKTFSMGHAQEKRYYLEARKIL